MRLLHVLSAAAIAALVLPGIATANCGFHQETAAQTAMPDPEQTSTPVPAESLAVVPEVTADEAEDGVTQPRDAGAQQKSQ